MAFILKSPSTITSVNSPAGAFASVDWTNPSNATSENGSLATSSIQSINNGGSNYGTDYLRCVNFGFTIPDTATIDGVKLEAKISASAADAGYDMVIKLVKAGTVSGNDKQRDLFVAWPTTLSYVSWGGETDLWGLTLSPSNVNASDFGAVISAAGRGEGSATVRVDHVRITVYYTEAITSIPGLLLLDVGR